MAGKWIKKYCEGKGKQFGGKCCPYYEQPPGERRLPGECRLLKEHSLCEVFERGRCNPSNMVEKIVEWTFRAYSDVIVDFRAPDEKQGKHIQGLIEALIFDITPRIQRQRLTKSFTIHSLKKYINETVVHEVWATLEEMGEFLKKICKHCIYLFPSNPEETKFICQRETLITSDKGEIENPYYEKKRRPSDKACKGGFDPLKFGPLSDVFPLDAAVNTHRIVMLAEALNNRIATAEDEDTRRIYERQYVVFCKFIHWLENENISSKVWRKKTAQQLGVNERTLLRDINAIVNSIHEIDEHKKDENEHEDVS